MLNLKKACFLDRDGIINIDSGYVYRIEDFIFIEGIFELCHIYQKEGYLLIIVTNQAGIARGYFTEKDYQNLNSWMLEEFNKKAIHITDVFYSPHHEKHGIGGYKQVSMDRKPNPGMILSAKEKYNIELTQSLLLGDKESDMIAGERANIGRLIFINNKIQQKKWEQYPTLKEFVRIEKLKTEGIT